MPEAGLAGNGRLVLDDERLEEVLELTQGAFLPCYQCGVCTATCPWGEVRSEPLSVRRIVRAAQLGAHPEAAALWQCTGCALCQSRCPKGVEIVRGLWGLRRAAFRRRETPPELERLLWGTLEDGNPWGGAPGERARWARDLEVPRAGPGREVLLYVGCAVSYDPRLQRLARAACRLLEAAGVSYGILGEAEACCGDSVMAAGEDAYLEELIQGNIQAFREAGAETVVAISPHCLHMFREVYPRHGAGFEALHVTQLLARLLHRGELRFGSPAQGAVTYHDPCFLGRWAGEYGAPRELLEAAGFSLREMAASEAEAPCCGGGGGRMWLETDPAERLANRRVEEARETGAATLATSCPYCIQNFEDAAGAGEPLPVVDVLEAAARAL